MMDHKDFEMANGKYSNSSTLTDWRNDPYYFSAINLDRDVPEWDEDEEDGRDDDDLSEEEEDRDERDEDENDWEDLEDDTHDGGSHRESEGNDDWSGYHDDLD